MKNSNRFNNQRFWETRQKRVKPKKKLKLSGPPPKDGTEIMAVFDLTVIPEARPNLHIEAKVHWTGPGYWSGDYIYNGSLYTLKIDKDPESWRLPEYHDIMQFEKFNDTSTPIRLINYSHSLKKP